MSDPAPALRRAIPEDAEALVALFRALDAESEYMLFEPGERETSRAGMAARIAEGAVSGGDTLFVAPRSTDEGSIVLDGFVGARRPSYFRGAHALHLVLGVRREASGRGLGRALLGHVERHARGLGIRRLDLGVLVSNARAIALYERAGFVHEGRRRDAVRLRSGYVDELMMAKLLDPPEEAA